MCQRNFQCAFLAAVASVTLMSSAAGAQQATSTDAKRDMNDLYNHSETTSRSNAAINTDRRESRTAAAPVAGRNSFTESEARRRIQSFGYTGVSALKKDAQGIWRGSAARNGQTADIALDYQGNIVSAQP